MPGTCSAEGGALLTLALQRYFGNLVKSNPL
jgi:hypothetical protein